MPWLSEPDENLRQTQENRRGHDVRAPTHAKIGQYKVD